MQNDDKLYELHGNVSYIRSTVDHILKSHVDLQTSFDEHKDYCEKTKDRVEKRLDKIEWKVGLLVTSALLIVQNGGKWVIEIVKQIMST